MAVLKCLSVFKICEERFAMIGTRIYQKAIADITLQPPRLVMHKEKAAMHANKIAAVIKTPN